MEQPTREGLVRGIRKWDLVAVVINGIIGAGIFGLPSEIYAKIGAYSLIAFVACAIVVGLIILCFAEVASRFDKTGGPYLYARKAFGPLIGFEVGWLQWLARITAFAANINLLVTSLGFFWPTIVGEPWRSLIIIGLTATLAAINIVGVRSATVFGNFFTVGKLIPLIFFVVAGLFFINFNNFSFAAPPGAPPLGYSTFSLSVLLLIYAFTGFEMAVIPAGEVRNPQRNIPIALLTAIGVVAAHSYTSSSSGSVRTALTPTTARKFSVSVFTIVSVERLDDTPRLFRGTRRDDCGCVLIYEDKHYPLSHTNNTKCSS